MPDIEAKLLNALPEQLAPPLATPQQQAPSGDWVYEIKYHGHRLLTRVVEGEVRMFYRNGEDWTERLPVQVDAVASLELENTWLDGELVAIGDEGVPDFLALQAALESGDTGALQYYLFDLPFYRCSDLRERPLEERRAQLAQLLGHGSPACLKFSAAFASRQAEDILECAGMLHIEGLIAKRVGSPYRSERCPDWIKLDCAQQPGKRPDDA
ncbi:hypothetical protein SFA35_17185 [Pseudomonas sp. HR96]|uniref:ATP-dependent DNA ligase n=1 Tax=Pseudomonas sp. HR96 TaxID=1027966 RepID=UPI002A76030A|nr:hypothetical protein [Pseudomonas sp. HR96]WPO98370.1 hypothetical protein SFA35_17185 [Pseudomonas sp. HR96]